jgi:hypothetical protein
MKKVAFLLMLVACTTCIAVITASIQKNESWFAARLNPPAKVVEAAEAIALEKSPYFDIRYEKDGGYWTALIFNYSQEGIEIDVELAHFKANGKKTN